MSAPLSETNLQKIRALLASKNKIGAIQFYRTCTGAELAESKDAIEKIEGNTQAVDLPADKLNEINQCLLSGNKIAAIKIYRSACHTELKDSKEAVDRLERELRMAYPEKFSEKSGCVSVLIAMVFLADLAFYWIA